MARARGRIAIVVVAVAGACAWLPADAADDEAVPRIDVAGTARLPATAAVVDGSTVAIDGVSGLAWLGDDGWAAVMDNGAALLSFDLEFGADGRRVGVRDVRAVRLAERHDYEDVAACPPALAVRLAAGSGRALLVCEEDTPALRVVDGAGVIVGGLPIPGALATRRPNRGLEALCAAPDGSVVWTANEEALPEDGPPPAPGTGTVVRIVQVPCAAGAAGRGRQIAYAVDPPHACATVAAGPAYSGLVALAALPDGRLLVLERSAARCLPPFENRLYVVDPLAAPDVAGIAGGLAARPDTHAAKRLAWRGGLGCNLEGLALGPPLASGGTALVAVADAGGLDAPSRIVVLRLDPPLTSP